jgi:DNA-binding transcriptional MerR regulator
MKTPPPPRLLKMADLARESGVPAPTIKHYIREGLLPQPAARTGRTMAWYDAAIVPRIKAIKKLQATRFLPLKVIKSLLDDNGLAAVAATEETIAAVLRRMAPAEVRTRARILAAGMPADELDWLASIGLVTPSHRGKAEQYVGDDLVLLDTLQAARDAGLTREMLPPRILESYLKAVQALVSMELELFSSGVLGRAGADLPGLTEAATVLSERLVVLMRRKLLLPTLRNAVQQKKPAPQRAPQPKRRGRS